MISIQVCFYVNDVIDLMEKYKEKTIQRHNNMRLLDSKYKKEFDKVAAENQKAKSQIDGEYKLKMSEINKKLNNLNEFIDKLNTEYKESVEKIPKGKSKNKSRERIKKTIEQITCESTQKRTQGTLDEEYKKDTEDLEANHEK